MGAGAVAGKKRPRVQIGYDDEEQGELEYEYEEEDVAKPKKAIKQANFGDLVKKRPKISSTGKKAK